MLLQLALGEHLVLLSEAEAIAQLTQNLDVGLGLALHFVQLGAQRVVDRHAHAVLLAHRGEVGGERTQLLLQRGHGLDLRLHLSDASLQLLCHGLRGGQLRLEHSDVGAHLVAGHRAVQLGLTQLVLQARDVAAKRLHFRCVRLQRRDRRMCALELLLHLRTLREQHRLVLVEVHQQLLQRHVGHALVVELAGHARQLVGERHEVGRECRLRRWRLLQQHVLLGDLGLELVHQRVARVDRAQQLVHVAAQALDTLLGDDLAVALKPLYLALRGLRLALLLIQAPLQLRHLALQLRRLVVLGVGLGDELQQRQADGRRRHTRAAAQSAQLALFLQQHAAEERVDVAQLSRDQSRHELLRDRPQRREPVQRDDVRADVLGRDGHGGRSAL
eukprot:Unigene14390_Nuclearia_a/m.43416 Unigene14390_Nuclearia_a/g.43416  ORF Unigene14390_Nuclearia_a/g.43416 Unigene14390_Nuclearia_a/m.43416 type:complete len:388 (+) Unigene14390_Nuclearia_a:505-1668(+)